MLTDIGRGLHHTLRCRPYEQHPPYTQGREQQLERGVVKGGIPMLEQDMVTGPRQQLPDDVAARPARRLPRERRRVAVPTITIVIDIDHRDASLPCPGDRRAHPRATLPERREQQLSIPVVEVGKDVDHQCVAVLKLDYVAASGCIARRFRPQPAG